MTWEPRSRPEWVDEPRVMQALEDEPCDMSNFAYGSTRDLLLVEDRLLALATLVQGCARIGGIADEAWPGIEALASTLLGPSRSASQRTPVNAMSRAVASDLRGEVVRRRYIAALRNIASDVAEMDEA